MKTAGIICEYNPFHFGHLGHIEKTRSNIGENTAIVCVMSSNYVQRGDFAVFNKHARAKAAILNGADLVLELPTPFVLMSAEGFANAGVCLLNALGVCDYLSFGSEANDIILLQEAADMIITEKADMITKEQLDKGDSYATAQQHAANTLMGKNASVFKLPNNVLGIEYLKALKKTKSTMIPMTMNRTGGNHDSDTGYSASAVRKKLRCNDIPYDLIPETAIEIFKSEISAGRGPVSIKNAEQAILSRLRSIKDYSKILGISEGLEQRFMKHASNEPTVELIMQKIKTKRYPFSRIRRALFNAILGIEKEYATITPPYIRILAMNETGTSILKKAQKTAKLPIITKPASVKSINEESIKLFNSEASTTDFYVLAYQNENDRHGNQEWRKSPIILN